MARFCAHAVLVGVLWTTISVGEAQQEVVVDVVPSYERLEEDDFAHFECNVQPSNTTVQRIRWFRNDGERLPIGRHFYFSPRRTDFIIEPLWISDTGVYRCEVSTPQGVFSATMELVVVPYQASTPCSSNPCRHDGRCVEDDQGLIYRCSCTPDYEGTNCEYRRRTNAQFYPCQSSPCQNGALCQNVGTNGYICECGVGYTGPLCAQEIGACTSQPCTNNGNCLNTRGGFQCQCDFGYQGETCQEVEDFCYSNPCLNNGECFPMPGHFECQCHGGWGGERCEEDINDCLPDPCYGHGNCTDLLGAYSCNCRPGFRGPRCQHDIDECASRPCQNNGRCVNSEGSFLCQCRIGYEGIVCQIDIDECASNPCLNGATCHDSTAGYRCQCQRGNFGRRCENGPPPSGACTPSTCKNSGQCNETEDGYICSCQPGTYGKECENTGDICQSGPCSNQGSCVEIPTGYACSCQLGYSGRRCQIEINECDSSPCLNDGRCVDEVNAYSCVCSGVFVGQRCERDSTAPDPTPLVAIPSPDPVATTSMEPTEPITTAGVEPCAASPCVNGHCSPRLSDSSSFTCRCHSGFSGRRCDEIILLLPTSAAASDIYRITVMALLDGVWEEVTRQENVPSRNFPLTLTGLPGGHYSVSIDEQLEDGGLETVALSQHGETDDVVPAWAGEEIFAFFDTEDGISMRLRLPAASRFEQRQFDSWFVQRRVGGSPWESFVFPISQLRVIIAGVLPGAMQLRVSASSPQRNSPYSPVLNMNLKDFCASQSCSGTGTCVTKAAAFQCTCSPGYTGTTCQDEVIECDSSPCQNGGDCLDDINSYSCRCQPGYEGYNCQTDIDECTSSPCLHNGRCQDVEAGYVCDCVPGYGGLNCEEDIQECQSQPCENGGWCVDGISAYTCQCPSGYTGDRCQQEVNECESSPCQRGSECMDGLNGYSCLCIAGFTGRNCEQEINGCNTKPCSNGRCRHLSRGQFECICDRGYTGRLCEEVVDFCEPSPCENGGTCTSTDSVGFTCRCPQDFNGERCEEAVRNYCEPQPCMNGATCHPRDSGYDCSCANGYAGENCQQAQTRPCDSSPCQNNGACYDFGTEYRCRCRSGFEGSDCSRRLPARGACASGPCQNGARCASRGRRYRCYCPRGFRGRHCEQETCRVAGEVYQRCSSSCPATCDQPIPSCQSTCVSACQCDIGLVYGNSSKLTCIRPSRCPNPTLTPKYAIQKPGTGSFLVCAGNMDLESITSVQWSRADGGDIAPNRHQLFTRNTNLYIENHQLEDTGDYVCTVFTGLLSQTATAHIEVTEVKATIQPGNVRGERGGSVDMTCAVSPASAVVTRVNWKRSDGRPFSSGRTKFSDDRRTVSIDSLRRSDSAEYVCTVVTNLGTAEGKTSFVVGEKGCIADGKLMSEDDSRYIFSEKTVRDAKPAADIVFLVDESGSMAAEHAWLANVSIALDTSLVANGIGVDLPNQFGLIGFAKDDPSHVRGRVIEMPDGDWMGTATEFNEVRTKLALDGRTEDMYTAIELALDFYPLRPGMACQIIGVTDEGRTPLPLGDGSSPLTRSVIQAKLKARGCLLNVIINEQMKSFEEEGIVDALAVTGNNDSTVEVPGGDFRIVRGTGVPVPRSAHGSTHTSYTELAFNTGGAAWDLNRLRVGGDTARSFTKAFVWLKEREISQQLCTRCRCEGTGAVAVCMPGCLSEPPLVIYTATSSGHGNTLKAVNEGGLAEFSCESDGEPPPEFIWQLEGGGNLPVDSRIISGGGGRSILQVPNVKTRLCVECISENSAGSLRQTQCLDSLGKCSLPGQAVDILHGDSVRNYSTHRGDDLVRLPSSAVVVLVVDESGSMVGEHVWLNTTVQALEDKLQAKGVGVVRPNRYALVGFASPSSVKGRIIPLGAGGEHCGTASQMSGALGQLQVDGQLEDGYAAMTLALNSISCLQDERENQTACQVILATDEGRDRLSEEIQYDSMLDTLSGKDCILNVVVWERFRGRVAASVDNPRPHWQTALGIDRHRRAVIPEGSNFAFLPEGDAWAITGRENTHRSYVELATQTGGGAWDLEKLRTERYREAFTNGFISAKVEEIQQQIFGRCEECSCRYGNLECSSVEGVSTRQRCISPPANRLLGVVIAPLTEYGVDGSSYAKFQCSALLDGKEDNTAPITVTWVTHPIQAVVDLENNELQFSNVTSKDEGIYTCQARTADGYGEASVDLNIGSQDSKPESG